MKPKQGPARPKAKSGRNDGHQASAKYVLAPENAPAHKTSRTMRKPPDIEAVARLGGLPDSVKPYKLDNRKGDFYSAQHGNSTETVNRSLEAGFAKVVETARDYSLRFKTVSPSEIGKHIPNIGWAGDTWIEENILRSQRSDEELGKELRDKLIADIPEVNRWGVAPATPAETTERGAAFLSPTNRFVKEGETWTISFAGETCRLPASLIGLDYISVLLRYAGKSIGAQQLRAQGAAAVPVNPGRLSDLATDPDAGLQTEWTPHAVLDATTITNYQNAINDLNDRITYAQDTGNTREVETLEKEKDNLLRELSKQKGLPGRPREFPNQKESARSTVTHAIKLAFKKIEKTAPITAEHLRNNIVTGTFLTYRDCSVSWRT